jgi:hypothetical protein
VGVVEDIFITTERVPSAAAKLSAFVYGCWRIAEDSQWDLHSNEIRPAAKKLALRHSTSPTALIFPQAGDGY